MLVITRCYTSNGIGSLFDNRLDRELLSVQTCLNRSCDPTRKGAVYTAHAPRRIVTNDEPQGVAARLYLKLAAISKSLGANLLSNIRG